MHKGIKPGDIADIFGGIVSRRERSAGVKKRSGTAQSLKISKGRTLTYKGENTQDITPFTDLALMSYTGGYRIPTKYP